MIAKMTVHDQGTGDWLMPIFGKSSAIVPEQTYDQAG